VRDDGVGDPGGPGSLGKQLVVALAGQLGGTVSGDDTGPGTTARAVFPASRFIGMSGDGADRAA
jgi:two-component sensor histidine kinase